MIGEEERPRGAVAPVMEASGSGVGMGGAPAGRQLPEEERLWRREWRPGRVVEIIDSAQCSHWGSLEESVSAGRWLAPKYGAWARREG